MVVVVVVVVGGGGDSKGFFELELLRRQPCCFAVYHRRAEKRLSRDVFDIYHIFGPCS